MIILYMRILMSNRGMYVFKYSRVKFHLNMGVNEGVQGDGFIPTLSKPQEVIHAGQGEDPHHPFVEILVDPPLLGDLPDLVHGHGALQWTPAATLLGMIVGMLTRAVCPAAVFTATRLVVLVWYTRASLSSLAWSGR